MNKKSFLFVLTALSLSALTGCGGGGDQPSESSSTTPVSSEVSSSSSASSGKTSSSSSSSKTSSSATSQSSQSSQSSKQSSGQGSSSQSQSSQSSEASSSHEGSSSSESTSSQPTHEHQWSDWEVIQQPTTTEEGLERRTCATCNEIETRTIDPIQGDFYFSEVEDGYSVSYAGGGSVHEGDLEIPASYRGKPVTQVSQFGFNAANVKGKIILPDTLTRILDYGFGQAEFEDIILPDSLVSIGYGAFVNASSAFYFIPSSVQTIGEKAFGQKDGRGVILYCEGAEPTGRSSYLSFGKVYTGVTRDKVYIENGFHMMRDNGTRGSVVLYTGKTFGMEGDPSLPNTGYIGDESYGIDGIGSYAFAGIELPDEFYVPGITYIRSYAFSGCRVETLYITNFMTGQVDSYALPQTLFAHVTVTPALNYYAVRASYVLCTENQAYVHWDAQCFGGAEVYYGRYAADALAIDDNGSVYIVNKNSQKAMVARLQGDKIPASVTKGEKTYTVDTLGSHFISSSVTSIVVPNFIKTVNAEAFVPASGYSQLGSVTFEGTIKDLPKGAFKECYNLTSVTFKGDVSTIGDNAFQKCQNLESIALPNGLTKIGIGAFADSGLKEFTVPGSLNTIGNDAFYGVNLEKLNIPFFSYWRQYVTLGNVYSNPAYSGDTPTQIYTGNADTPDTALYISSENESEVKPYIYAGFASISQITFSENVKKIGAQAFAKTGVTEIVLPNGMSEVGDRAFAENHALTSFSFNDYIYDVKDKALEDCDALVSLRIVANDDTPSQNLLVYKLFGVDSYGRYKIPGTLDKISFKGTTLPSGFLSNIPSLSSLVLEEGVTTIESWAFGSTITKLDTIDLPASIRSFEASLPTNSTKLNFHGDIHDYLAFAESTNNEKVRANFRFVEEDKNPIVDGCLVIPSDVTSIPAHAFDNWEASQFDSVFIPDTVEEVGYYAFPQSKLYVVGFAEDNRPSGWDADWYHSGSYNTTVIYNVKEFYEDENAVYVIFQDDTAALYRLRKAETATFTVPDKVDGHDVTSILGGAINKVEGLTKVVVSEGITNLETDAIVGDSTLGEICLPTTVTKLSINAINAGQANVYCAGDSPEGRYSCTYAAFYDHALGSLTVDGFLLLHASDDTYAIQGYVGGAKSFEIPAQVGDYPISAILPNAFQNNLGVISVTLGDNVAVGKYAFQGATALKKVTLGKNATINYSAFRECADLEEVVLGEAAYLDQYCFYSCTSLAKMDLSKVTNFGNYCLYETSLVSVHLPSKAKATYGKYAFEDISTVEELIYDEFDSSISPDSLRFSKSSLKSVKILGGVLDSQFSNLSGLTSLFIGKNVTEVGGYFMSGLSNAEVIFEEGAEITFNGYAFSGLTADAFHVPANSILKPSSLYGSKIGELYIPASVTIADQSQRLYWNDIDNIYIEKAESEFTSTNFVDKYDSNVYFGSTGSVIVGDFTLVRYVDDTYAIASYNGEEADVLNIPAKMDGKKIVEVGKNAFKGHAELKQVALPEGVTRIGDYAFMNCPNLFKLNVPSTVTYLGQYMLQDNSEGAVAVYVGFAGEIPTVNSWWYLSRAAGVIRNAGIKDHLFVGDHVLGDLGEGKYSYVKYLGTETSIDLTKDLKDYNVTTMVAYAFRGSLQSIVLPKTLKSIPDWAFYEDSSRLREIVLPEGLETIGADAFMYTPAPYLAIPSTVTSAKNAFADYRGVVCLGHNVMPEDWNLPADDTGSKPKIYLNAEGMVTINGVDYVLLKDGTAIVRGGTNSDYRAPETLEIPAEVSGHTVTQIGRRAFTSQSYITTLVLPDSIEVIDDYAFQYCNYIASFNLPASLRIIGQYGFAVGSNTTEKPTISALPSKLESVATYGLSGPRLVGVIVLPETLLTLGKNALLGTNQTSIVASFAKPEGHDDYPAQGINIVYEAVLDDTFVYGQGEDGLIARNYIGKGGEVVIPTTVGDKNVVALADRLFLGNTSITKVTIPASIKVIPASCFYGASNLASVIISDGVEEIDESAFSYCSSLTTLFIPKSVTTVKSGINTVNMTFYVQWPQAELPSGWASTWKSSGSTVYYGVETVVDTGDMLLIGKADGTYTLAKYTISSSATSVVFPSEYDGKYITEIGSGVTLTNNTKVTTVTLPDHLIEVPKDFFSGCTKLTSAPIPSTVTSIASGAFYNCYLLEGISLPEGLTSIGGMSFYNCRKIFSLDIPAGVKDIPNSAFWKCDRISTITFHEGLETIGNSAFDDCENLKKVILPSTVTTVGNSAFAECDALTYVQLGPNVTKIGQFAFGWDTSLRTLVIAPGVTNLDSAAFYGPSSMKVNLQTIYFLGTPDEWDAYTGIVSNTTFYSATRYYYSEEAPTDTENSYWHYVDGTPTVWPK